MHNTDTLSLAWAGGLNSPQFSSIDLDGDGFKDLFVFERDFYGSVKTFINKGIAEKARYDHAPIYQSAFPQLRNWALLADYNCDGREDIFTDVPFGVAVYRNDYSQSTGLKFNKISNLLQTESPAGTQVLFVASPDIPAIADVDNDGDLDFLTFGILGNYVEYHKNQSIENYGDCNKLEFELRNRCWGYFSENDNDNGITLNDTCNDNVTDPEKNERHAGSTVLAIDLNGSGTKDLLIGDISHENVVKLENGGTVTSSNIISYDTLFPGNSLPVDLSIFPASYHLDINNDGKKDLIVAPNNPVRSQNVNNVWYYKNTGEGSETIFTFQTDQFLQDEMIDVGEGARPVFFDYDDDGFEDIVIGNYGYFVSDGVYSSQLALFRNNGTKNNPSYTMITDDYSQLSELGILGLYPAFSDLNGDGVMEMVIGDEEGNVHLFVNTAGLGEPATFVLDKPNYSGIDVGQTAIPQIIDVDQDGKPDLLMGERSGKLNYFQNIGTLTAAAFSSIPTNDFFGGIDVMVECCTGYSSPFLVKDTTGKYQLYVGSEKGWLYMYNEIEDNLESDFNLVDSLYLHGVNITIDGSDINSDGHTELVYGELAGGIAILKSGSPSFLFSEEVKDQNHNLSIYPNPANTYFNIKFNGNESPNIISVDIVNIYGKVIDSSKHKAVDGQVFRIDLDNRMKGIYFIRIRSKEHVSTRKILVQ